jgi:phospholipid/cholesterol/gamma-HCH transport system substrate-binding protein
MVSEKWRTRVAGVIGLALLVGAVGATLGIYQKVFVRSVDVQVRADRAGLLLDKGSKVKAFGLPVGEVRKVDLQSDNSVILHLAIDPDQARSIPSGVTADIGASTVFGAKFVQLDVPEGPVQTPLASGEVLKASTVATEANDVFGSLQGVLTAVDPSQLNSTLTAMATALDGRGEQLGQYLGDVNSYVSALNEHTEPLTQDIQRSANVLDTYSDVAPDVLDTARSTTTTSRTLHRNGGNLGALLQELTQAAQVGTDFGETIERPLATSMDTLRAVTDLGARYSPEFTCLVKGLANHRTLVNKVFGYYPGIQGNVSLLPGQSGYTYPKDLSKLATGVGPKCYSLPEVADPTIMRHNFDDGSNAPYTPGGAGVTIGKDPVSIYGDLLEDFFGKSGLNELLGDPVSPDEEVVE